MYLCVLEDSEWIWELWKHVENDKSKFGKRKFPCGRREDGSMGIWGRGVDRKIIKEVFFFNCRRQKCKYIDHYHQEICLTWENHFIRLLEGILFTEILRLSTYTSIIPKNFKNEETGAADIYWIHLGALKKVYPKTGTQTTTLRQICDKMLH